MKNICYTIGYGNSSFENFIEQLRKNEINCIIDVRDVLSSTNTDSVYDSQNLKNSLNKLGIYYIFMGQEFAMDWDALKSDAEYLEKFTKTDKFKKGIERTQSGIKKGYHIALMSKEKDPLNCIRGIVISHQLEKHGTEMLHIVEGEDIKSHKALEQELVKNYGASLVKKVAELSIKYIMNNVNLELDESDFKVEMLEEAYRIKAREIADKNETAD